MSGCVNVSCLDLVEKPVCNNSLSYMCNCLGERLANECKNLIDSGRIGQTGCFQSICRNLLCVSPVQSVSA